MIVAWKRKLAERQQEIAQKYYEETGEWLMNLYSTVSENMVPEFMSVYNEMLSTLNKKQKPAPADLYKLDSYWELQKKARSSLEDIGKDIHSYFNSQLKSAFISIYEGIAPDELEKTCPMSDEEIQEIIDKPWGRKPKNLQERIWIHMTVLWDKLFGDLMNCTIKNIPAKDLEASLQERFSKTRNALVTLFSDENTHLRGRAVIRRCNDDRRTVGNELNFLGSYVRTYGNDEELEAYATVSSAFDEYAIAGADGVAPANIWDDSDEDNEDDWTEDSEENQGARGDDLERWEIHASDGCEPCADLDDMIWAETNENGPVPVTVHPNCLCDIVPAALSIFGQDAGKYADLAFKAAGGGLRGIIFGGLVGAALITLGVMMGDEYNGTGGSGCATPQEWLEKWGDKYPVY